MPFVKYNAPSKRPKPTPDVKIGTLGLSINKSALEKFGFSDASHVNLWFDADRNSVAISAAELSDKSAFKTTLRGKSKENIFIPAGKFYAAFEIAIREKNGTAALQEVDGMASFELPGGKPRSTISTPYTGAKRGRKPKQSA